MDTSIKLSHVKNMQFQTEVNGHTITIDASPKVGGENKGPTPKPLMLVSLAGCTALDVISILGKMRVELDDFDVEVQADQTEEHPRYYHKMHVIYSFQGKNLPLDKLKKAVNLSEERYCGVSAVYKKAIDLTTEIRVNGETVEN
ncbi:MAG: OsmC family protein [Bacteroidales bacterium]|nr:OsmC family protein [Bacteroidales bacterium]